MNWRRGFFRFWVLGSALFVFSVAAISYSDIKAQFEAIALMKLVQHDELFIPALCSDARGVAGTDFTTKRGEKPGPWDVYVKPNPFDTCWYALSKFRALYPEYNDLSDRELSTKAYARHGIVLNDPPNPWMSLVERIALALSIPLIVLILGAALVWALSGFKKSMRP